MEYHKDRFTDASLLFYDGDKLVGLLPANRCEEQQSVYSHQGLTYGGILVSHKTHYLSVQAMLHAAIAYYKEALNAHTLVYKAIPHIYHAYPSEEDLYAIHRQNGTLSQRAVSSCVALSSPLPFSELRRRKVNAARRETLRILRLDGTTVAGNGMLDQLWKVLSTQLLSRHDTVPTHQLHEIKYLWQAFPCNIQPYVVCNSQQRVIAGCILFLTQQVVHVQYIASDDEGRAKHALDYLFNHLIHEVKHTQQWFDFGISTEQGGQILNEGLLFQKEGFGGRAICYDTYRIDFSKHTQTI